MIELDKDNTNKVSLEKTPEYAPQENNVPGAIPGGEGVKLSKGCLAAVIAAIVLVIVVIAAAVTLIFKGSFAVFGFFREAVEEENRPETVATPTGEFELEEGALYAFYSAMYKKDAQAMSSALDQYPYLVYYIKDGGSPLLDVVANEDVPEMTQTMLDHGAKFDDAFTHQSYYTTYTLEGYLSYHADKTVKISSSRDVNGSVKLMLDNGAAVEFGHTDENVSYDPNSIARKPGQVNALFDVAVWICRDETLDEKDVELMKMLLDAGADKTEKNFEGKTALENFEDTAEWYELDSGSEYYKQLTELLK